ncbi:MAG: hypothetical protein GX769_03875 [Erysipelothrix sp.]|nr:hypothetical protein [Erysipelothrix sp.]
MIKIIAPKYQHDSISRQLLKDNNLVVNTTLLPLNAFIDQLVPKYEDDYDTILKAEILALKDQLKVLFSYVENSTFIKSIKDFHIDMYLYNIKPNDLEASSLKDQDLKLIFETIYKIVPNEIKTLNDLELIITPLLLENVYLSKQKLSSNYLKEVVNLLKANKIKEYSQKELELNKIKLYYANNKRSEVEASAQMIIDKDLSRAQVIALNSDYLPLIKQVYKRYNIKFTLVNKTENKTFFINFISLLKLIEDQSKASVVEFLSSNPLNLENITSLIKLNDFFKFDLKSLLEYKYQPLTDNIVHKSNLDYYQQLGETSKVIIDKLKPTITKLAQYNTKLQLVENLFNYFLDQGQSDDLKILRQVLVNNKQVLDTGNNIWPILQNLLLNPGINNVDINNVVVSQSNNHYYFDKKDLIILGASANNFPVIDKKTGVIDEKYVANLTYPSKEKRFSNQLLEQDLILNGENIYIFYPLSSYAGKGIEPSFPLVNYAKKNKATALRYPLIENDTFEFKSHTLDEDIAKKLFFKDEMLFGSISSFEQYNNCNYSYFLKSGLKLYPQQLPDLSYAYIGSIIHEVMEQVVVDLSLNKKPLQDIDLISLINQLSISLETLYPNDKKMLMIKELLIRQLVDVLDHLKKVEADTTFKPIEAEAEFLYTINNKIKLKGFVDRTDQYLDSIRVIDFKSSPQNLSEKLFKQGLQLQLITYLLVMSEKYQLQPAGAFYHTMRTQNTSMIYAEVKKSQDFFYPTSEVEVEADYLKNNRLAGWHFKDPIEFYESKDYVGGLVENKSGLAVYGKPKNFETVTTILNQIYDDIHNNLKKGIIDCVPINNPCAFCEYQSICQSKTTKNFKQEIYPNQKLNKEIENEVD